MLARVQEQLTSRWERNQALVARTRDELARHEDGLMDPGSRICINKENEVLGCHR